MTIKRSLVILSIIIFLSIIIHQFLFKVDKKNTSFDIQLESIDGESIKLNNSNYKVLFILSDNCSSCIDKLSTIKRIIDIYKIDDINFYLCWEGSIPISKLIENNIDININYNIMYLSRNEVKPFVYILNQNNQIILDDYIFTNIPDLLLKSCSNSENVIRNNAISNILLNTDKNNDTQKKTLIIFTNKATSDFLKYEKEILSLCDYKYIMYDLGFNEDNDFYVDYGNVYKAILNIHSYPFYLLVDENMQIIKKISNKNILKVIKVINKELIKRGN